MVTNALAQGNNPSRIAELQSKLEHLSEGIPGLSQKVDFNITDTKLNIFLSSLANTHKVNINVANELSQISFSNNFTNTSVMNVLLFLCKEYDLTFEVTGNILSFKRAQAPQIATTPKQREIPVSYDAASDSFSIDLMQDELAVAFRKIADVTGKNLLYAPSMGTVKLSGYIKNKPLESALNKIAFTNNLEFIKTKDGYYLFQTLNGTAGGNLDVNGSRKKIRPRTYSNANFYYKVKDTLAKTLEVDFENTEIASVIRDIGHDLHIKMYTDTPLQNIGKATVKADDITYDWLLFTLLQNTELTYRKEQGMYIFGKNKSSNQTITEIVPVMHRSIELMEAPAGSGRANQSFGGGSFNTFGNFPTNSGGFNNGYSQNGSNNGTQNYSNNAYNNGSYQNGRNPSYGNGVNRRSGTSGSSGKSLMGLVPKHIKEKVSVVVDNERNSFIVTGTQHNIDNFRKALRKIDVAIPVILIEVMILEVSKSATVQSGVELGLGKTPTTDSGQLFPSGQVTLGAATINKIIGGFNGFGSRNIGRVVPNFYAKIHAMEANGNIKIRSTPKLSTLNGHEAILSNGERSYYAITRRDIIGSQNPQTTEIKNYIPINADLSIAIKPMVSGDNQITLSINVVQSSFNSKRIDEEAPPGMNTREFNSIVRVKNQDLVILGGLEENVKNDSGSGVPFLARVPIIKWFFSKKTRTKSKKKLSVLIKPTILN